MSAYSVDSIMEELSAMGSPNIKKILMAHGAKEPVLGVKVGDMKSIVKKVKKDYDLSLGLYSTGVYDAMYLAGLIADEKKMTEKDLERWVKEATASGIGEYTVPWIASESAHGWKLGLKWIESPKENIAASGWTTLANVVTLVPDDALDIAALKKLMGRVKKEIHAAPNRVRYAMNCFIISVGGYVKELTTQAKEAAKAIGCVEVEMNGTACNVPNAFDYITKIEKMGRVGKKKKQARC